MSNHYITRTRYARRRMVLTLAFTLASFAFGTWYARAIVGAPRWTHDVHATVVRCEGWAEDSAAHLRLVSFDRGIAYYRCKVHGY
jgi:hypothetical protein